MIRSSKQTARKKRAEHKVIKEIRPLVAERDGYCRILKDWHVLAIAAIGSEEAAQRFRHINALGSCNGPSEWAHLGAFKRFKTRRLPPDVRHQAKHSLMLCGVHHRKYDANQFTIEELTEAGADGPLAYRLK